MVNLLIRHSLSENPFALSLSKREWILVLRQAQHERLSSSIRAGSIDDANSVFSYLGCVGTHNESAKSNSSDKPC